MSKRMNKKRFGAKHSPLGVSSGQGSNYDANFDEIRGKMPAVISNTVEKLTSGTAEERECGCNMVAALGVEPGAIELLMKHNVVRILGPLVKDESINVRLAALGALRNISVDGAYQVCERMVELDVMTPLVILLKQYDAEWKPDSRTSPQNEVYIQAVNLLWNLCESSETAVKIFNQEKLARHLADKLNPLTHTYPVCLPTAQCLQTVSEDNKALPDQTQLQSLVTSLLEQTQEPAELDHVLLKTVLIGILYNVTAGTLCTDRGSMLAPSVLQLAHITSRDIGPLAEELLNALEQTTAEKDGGQLDGATNAQGAGDAAEEKNGDGEDDDEMESEDSSNIGANAVAKEAAKYKVVESARRKLLNVVKAKQLAFELLSNLCFADDESDEWEEMEETSDTEETMDVALQQETDPAQTTLAVSSDLRSLLLEHHVIDDVIKSCLVSDNMALQTIISRDDDECKMVAKQLLILQERALTCLNNMAASLTTENLGGEQKLLELWQALSKLVTSQYVKSTDSLVESVTSCIRALAQKLAEVNGNVFTEVTESDLQFLYTLVNQSSNASVRIHCIRTVAVIGSTLAKINPPHIMMKPIGVFLLVACMRDADVLVQAETLDAMFDVFSEDHQDPVAVDIGLVQKLKQFAPAFKNKIREQKSRYVDHSVVIQSAKTNLTRFIKYKNG